MAQDKSRRLAEIGETLGTVGWFIPPYISVAFLATLARQIQQLGGSFTQEVLQEALSFVYDTDRLASMVLCRYRSTPVIELFAETISESVIAHFSRLPHVAVGGLIPVIEGAGRRLAKDRGLDDQGSIQHVFSRLAIDAKIEVVNRRIGAVDEIVDMLDSFLEFVKRHFYARSQAYPLPDGTNRHGIAHGAYADAEYGKPINFYKTIAAVDFLTFVSSLRTKRMSGFAPERTAESWRLDDYYRRRCDVTAYFVK